MTRVFLSRLGFKYHFSHCDFKYCFLSPMEFEGIEASTQTFNIAFIDECLNSEKPHFLLA